MVLSYFLFDLLILMFNENLFLISNKIKILFRLFFRLIHSIIFNLKKLISWKFSLKYEIYISCRIFKIISLSLFIRIFWPLWIKVTFNIYLTFMQFSIEWPFFDYSLTSFELQLLHTVYKFINLSIVHWFEIWSLLKKVNDLQSLFLFNFS